jgi:spore maturation protein CgeB
MSAKLRKILCIGEEWRGSDASGLFYALSRQGCIVNVVNELSFISANAHSITGKILNRIVRRKQIDDFNQHIQAITAAFSPDVILIYKGAFIRPELLLLLRKWGYPVVNFFPDVSFLAHGKLIPLCVPLYDYIFTTKTFAANDLTANFSFDQKRVSFIPHGFDPLVHRPITSEPDPGMQCDASFIGNFSKHKADYLSSLKNSIPNLNLKIWGGTWGAVKDRGLVEAVQGRPVIGDMYSLALNSSAINVALLSERVKGASNGDQITSRTFTIPASRSFMLHQRTDEVQEYFVEDKEIVCFDSPEELVDKVRYYLNAKQVRKRIRDSGYQRAVMEHSLDARAKLFLTVLQSEVFF